MKCTKLDTKDYTSFDVASNTGEMVGNRAPTGLLNRTKLWEKSECKQSENSLLYVPDAVCFSWSEWFYDGLRVLRLQERGKLRSMV